MPCGFVGQESQTELTLEITTTRSMSVLVDHTREQRPRWRPGDRLESLFELQCDVLDALGMREHPAVDTGERVWSYRELDRRANQLARLLAARGVRPGDRVALLFEHGVEAYVAMLAALKAHTVYVPLDPGFPPDRIEYILRDAGIASVLTVSRLLTGLPDLDSITVGLVVLDRSGDELDAQAPTRPTEAEVGPQPDNLAYLIYTSGSTGRPKGVAIDHAAICNFVRVAAAVYGVTERDRMYQGLTLAFDFAVEETWVPWMAGATVVPKPAGANLLGDDLHEFLIERRVTAMCCVPTLLATIEDDLPALRFLLVSGEACPQDLIARWWRPDRRFLNVYGPTEACVTATWTELHPGTPVTIGVPLPTYAAVVLDRENPFRALPCGEVGEIGLAGIGLARGYLNRDDLTAQAFIPDFLGIAHNRSNRIYRTGDLGRVNQNGEIEYLGRIDLQVKIRGYRIELTEIEAVLLEHPAIAQAVVDTHRPDPATTELVGYYRVFSGEPEPDPAELRSRLRDHLPPYMVPTYLERLDDIPMTLQGKADRAKLPPPSRTAPDPSGPEPVAADTITERALAGALGEVLGAGEVSVTSDFFDDLNANSLVLARFATQVRALGTLPRISIKDIYLNRTIRALAGALDAQRSPSIAAPDPTRVNRSGGPAAEPASAGSPPPPTAQPAPADPAKPAALAPTAGHRASRAAHLGTGLAQLSVFLLTAYLGALLFRVSIEYLFAAPAAADAALAVRFGELYQRAALVGALLFTVLTLLPIAAKWLLVKRWTPREIPLWSLAYLRFWLVKSLIRANPLTLFAGTPLYLWYLRMLGAKIGRGVMLHARVLPVATDLITIGDGAVLGKNVTYNGYRAVDGVIQTGPVTLGAGAHVAENTVLDIDTEIGAGGELGHSSSLQATQRVPAGQTWHGCPAVPTATSYRTCPELPGRQWRKVVYTLFLLFGIFVVAPAGLALAMLVLPMIPVLTQLYTTGLPMLGTQTYHLVVVAIAAALFVLGLLGGLLFIATVPRLLSRLITPGRAYPLYGFIYLLHQAVTGMTNSKFFMYLSGDSSAVTHYLRLLGYDLGRVQQSGSNFGTELRHDSPYLTRIGTGTMVSDALSVNNADYSRTAFTLSPVAIGDNNYLGNHIAYPAGGRTGENVLMATKVLIPIDGPVWENCGMLGAPPFRIPRSVDRDSQFDHLKEPEPLRRALRGKNRHNTGTALLFLGLGWVRTLIGLLTAGAVLGTYRQFGEFALVAAGLAGLVAFTALGLLVELLTLRFRRLTPKLCSIYDPYFWRHERHWKLLFTPRFPGTPLNPLLLRLAGVRMGKRVFDDGVGIPEKTLTTIGDDATLNFGSVVQCHSLEDGTFKSDHSTLGAGATLGVRGFVHYGVVMRERTHLDADAFLMKGEEVPEGERWFGNPARPEYERESPTQDHDELLRRRVALLEDELTRRRRSRLPAVLGAAALVLAVVNVSFVVEPATAGPVRPLAERLQALVPVDLPVDADTVAPAGPEAEAPAVTFVEDFYAMLPGDTSAAVDELTPAFQRRIGGATGFTRLYRDVASVSVEDLEVVDDRTVSATVNTRLKGRELSSERRTFRLAPQPDGGYLLDDAVLMTVPLSTG